MTILIFFAFLAGIVTILSPCILPILPIILSGTVGGKGKPLGIVTGFIISFTFFTLFLTSIVKLLNIPSDALRNISVVVLFVFGLSMFFPKFQNLSEVLFARLSKYTPRSKGNGYWGGFFVGLSVGLLWTPCVGPILASVISLALTGTVTGEAFFITLAYSLGTAIPMLLIIYGGRTVIGKLPGLREKSQLIQKAFGVIMILTSVAILFNFDRNFQSYILDRFPDYGTGLTKIEENQSVTEKLEQMKSGAFKNFKYAPQIIKGGEWFNLNENESELKISDLKGKVVLVDFWTYTCINCIRTLPYIKNWHAKYKDDGLVIIGVHTPEFEFEKSPENVAKAIKDFAIEYPVVQDNDYSTWQAYKNRYWPAKYLIDKEGVVRYTHFGEGAYDETEKKIQEMLSEDGPKISEVIDNPEYKIFTKTPEIYLGYWRMDYYNTPGSVKKDSVNFYETPSAIKPHHFAFGGDWKVGRQHSAASAGSSLHLKFEAREVFLVMRPIDESKESKVKVYLDGKLIPMELEGSDVKNSEVSLDGDRLYEIVKLKSPEARTLRLEFLDSNVEVFAFTFG